MIWLRKDILCGNNFPQVWQVSGPLSECKETMWLFKATLVLNERRHFEHLWGCFVIPSFSFSKTFLNLLWCAVRLDLTGNDALHCIPLWIRLHLNCSECLWILWMWAVSWLLVLAVKCINQDYSVEFIMYQCGIYVPISSFTYILQLKVIHTFILFTVPRKRD